MDILAVGHSPVAAHTLEADSWTEHLFCPGYGCGLFCLYHERRGLLEHPFSDRPFLDHQNPGSAFEGLDQSLIDRKHLVR
eukprot:Skav236727  [mRNA]  locus=scaffold2654:840:2110:+ [translate_table: standard]